MPPFSDFSYKIVKICCFSLSPMIVNWISLDLGLLVKQTKTFEYVTMGSCKNNWQINLLMKMIVHCSPKIHQEKLLLLPQYRCENWQVFAEWNIPLHKHMLLTLLRKLATWMMRNPLISGPITSSYSPVWPLVIVCFVWTTVQNPKTFNFQWYKSEGSRKSSHFRSCKQSKLEFFCLINDLNK